MYGAIIGDIVGSRFEHDRNNYKHKEFHFFESIAFCGRPSCHFTDDTVMTVATASVLLTTGLNQDCSAEDYALAYKEFGNLYPDAGYGSMFKGWLASSELSVNSSFGNGSAMRVSPIGNLFNSLHSVLHEAVKSCLYTHSHPEGIKGSQAVAAAVYMARHQESKPAIANYITKTFGYDLSRRLDEIRPDYVMDATCQGSVPEAIIAFLEATDFESAIRNAVSLGGDSDTIAAIAGSIAEAYYRYIPKWMIDQAEQMLDRRLLEIVHQFYSHLRRSDD